MRKLQYNMKWNFKYMQVSLYLPEYFLVSCNLVTEIVAEPPKNTGPGCSDLATPKNTEK